MLGRCQMEFVQNNIISDSSQTVQSHYKPSSTVRYFMLHFAMFWSSFEDSILAIQVLVFILVSDATCQITSTPRLLLSCCCYVNVSNTSHKSHQNIITETKRKKTGLAGKGNGRQTKTKYYNLIHVIFSQS